MVLEGVIKIHANVGVHGLDGLIAHYGIFLGVEFNHPEEVLKLNEKMVKVVVTVTLRR